MGLMNMGKSEGAQIIQLFGRGVRLKGKDFSLKREAANAPYQVRALQTISIMGLNASYMNRFLEEIEKEVPDYTDVSIEIKFNQPEEWDGKILTFRKDNGHDFRNQLVELTYSESIARRVTLDLRNKVSIATGGFNSQVAEDMGTYQENFLNEFSAFIDYHALLLELNRYKLLKGYRNLILREKPIEELLREGAFRLYSHKGQFDLQEAISGKIQVIAINLAKDYLNKFYADQEKAFLAKYLSALY